MNDLQDAEITMVVQDYGPSSEALYEEALERDTPRVMEKLDQHPQDAYTSAKVTMTDIQNVCQGVL